MGAAKGCCDGETYVREGLDLDVGCQKVGAVMVELVPESA